MLIFLPETPYYLILRGQNDQAVKVLQNLRGSSTDIKPEFESIAKRRQQVQESLEGDQGDLKQTMAILTSKAFIKPFIAVGVTLFLMQSTGLPILFMYLVNTFEESGSSIDPYLASIIVAAARVSVSIVASYFLKFCPRRLLFLSSAAVIIICFASASIVSYLTKTQSVAFSTITNWIPIAALMVGYASHSFGFGAVIRVMVGEVYPTEIRSLANAITFVMGSIAMAISGWLYPIMVDEIGFEGTFGVYSGLVALTTIYGFFAVPESKGKTLVKIEQEFDDVNMDK